MHQHVPEILQPHTKYSSRRELSFDVLDSSFIVSTAGSDSVGRGERSRMYTPGAGSLAAIYRRRYFNGLLHGCYTRETAVFIESTANGVTGLFYDLWKGAVDGTNGFVPVFIPWYIDPEYREPVPDNFEHTRRRRPGRAVRAG